MVAFKRRLSEYLVKEARCPKCIKIAKLAEGTNSLKLCSYHFGERQDLAGLRVGRKARGEYGLY
jgi:hypothetical protein